MATPIPHAERTAEEEQGWEIANRAFDLFTLDERREALKVFARLRYESVEERLMESVHRVIVRGEDAR